MGTTEESQDTSVLTEDVPVISEPPQYTTMDIEAQQVQDLLQVHTRLNTEGGLLCALGSGQHCWVSSNVVCLFAGLAIGFPIGCGLFHLMSQ